MICTAQIHQCRSGLRHRLHLRCLLKMQLFSLPAMRKLINLDHIRQIQGFSQLFLNLNITPRCKMFSRTNLFSVLILRYLICPINTPRPTYVPGRPLYQTAFLCSREVICLPSYLYRIKPHRCSPHLSIGKWIPVHTIYLCICAWAQLPFFIFLPVDMYIVGNTAAPF